MTGQARSGGTAGSAEPQTSSSIETVAAALQTAATIGIPCAPVRALLSTGGVDSAYAVQSAVVASRVAAGSRIVGRKVGLTNPKVQAQLGVDQPDFGVLLNDMACSNEVPVEYNRLLQPRIEAEIAFILAHDLDTDGPFSVQMISDSIAYAVPALEIVDSRIADWDIDILDTIADNGSSGMFVLGKHRTLLSEFDPVEVAMTMSRGTDTVSTGSGRECLGNPLLAVAWLAETACYYRAPLRRGDVVLSGALGPMVSVHPGDTFKAELSWLGDVSAVFTHNTERKS